MNSPPWHSGMSNQPLLQQPDTPELHLQVVPFLTPTGHICECFPPAPPDLQASLPSNSQTCGSPEAPFQPSTQEWAELPEGRTLAKVLTKVSDPRNQQGLLLALLLPHRPGHLHGQGQAESTGLPVTRARCFISMDLGPEGGHQGLTLAHSVLESGSYRCQAATPSGPRPRPAPARAAKPSAACRGRRLSWNAPPLSGAVRRRSTGRAERPLRPGLNAQAAAPPTPPPRPAPRSPSPARAQVSAPPTSRPRPAPSASPVRAAAALALRALRAPSSRGRAGAGPKRRRLDADPAAGRRAHAPKRLSVPDAPRPTPTTKRASAGGSRLLAWVLWLQAWRVAAPCPGACVCYNEPKVTTSCSQQGLQAVPAGIPATSQRIFLHGNRISHVPAASFRACRNLTILWLHSNVLARIDAAAFAGLALLEQLDLSDNAQLRSVDPATFHGLGRLYTLHLDRCGLQELGLGLFRGLAALQYLHLQDNALQALPDDTFRDLGNLTQKVDLLYLHKEALLEDAQRNESGAGAECGSPSSVVTWKLIHVFNGVMYCLFENAEE
ncbi:uncharacterized protein LOC144578748 [Callithrix jacchus]